MNTAQLRILARRALPLMTSEARAEAEGILDDLNRTANASDVEAAAAAFERDMRPVREAIVSALKAGDMEALRGLRAMLPHLLAEVNRSPDLADVLAFQLGKSLVTGLTAKPEDVV